jgi:hypothetical protein
VVTVSAGLSVFLILVGAILRFAVTWSPQNVNLQVIGVILMIGGGAGLIASIVLMTMRNRNKRSAEVFEQRRYIEPPVLSTGAGAPRIRSRRRRRPSRRAC